MRPSQLLAATLAVSVSAAWSNAFDNTNALANVKNVMIYGRQDNNQNSESAQPSRTDTPRTTTTDGKAESTGNSKESGKASGSEKPSNTAKETGSGTNSTSKPSITDFDPRIPAGGISMVTPAVLAGPQYYKIGEWVTFAWNYTSLSVTPSAIDILATCTANQATYTLAVNQSVQETGRVLWDTGAYQSTAAIPLLTETYTLLIYDAESSVSAAPKAGYLAPQKLFSFGMYVPQPYVEWKDFKCANCNDAMSAFERMTLKAMLITCGTTLGSLIYFAHSFGIL